MRANRFWTWIITGLSVCMVLWPNAGRGQGAPYGVGVGYFAEQGNGFGPTNQQNSGSESAFFTDSYSAGFSTNVACGYGRDSYSSSIQLQTGGTLGRCSGFIAASATVNSTTNQPGAGCGVNNANGAFHVNWADTITPVSQTLPSGSQVAMRITMVVHIDAILPALAFCGGAVITNEALVSAILDYGSGPLGIFWETPPGDWSFQHTAIATDVTANVGSPFPVNGSFQEICNVSAQWPCVPSNNGSISASQTVYLDSLTPGVSLSATSGLSYATPPPSDLTPTSTSRGINLTFSTISNDLYDVQSTTDLVSGAWSTIASNIAGSGYPTNYIDATAGVPQKFYRVYVHF